MEEAAVRVVINVVAVVTGREGALVHPADERGRGETSFSDALCCPLGRSVVDVVDWLMPGVLGLSFLGIGLLRDVEGVVAVVVEDVVRIKWT